MKASRVLVPIVCVAVGYVLGAFVAPEPYLYGEHNGAKYRVNRFTGVEQYASSKGWVSQREAIGDALDAAFGGMREGVRTDSGFGQP